MLKCLRFCLFPGAAAALVAGFMLPLAQPAGAQLTVGGAIISKGIDEYIQRRFEERVERILEDNVEEEIQDEVEGDIELIIEDSIEQSLEDSIAANVEESAEESIEEALEGSVAQAVEESVEQGVEATLEDSLEASVEESVESGVEAAVEERVADAVVDRLEGEIDEIIERIENELEVDERRINRHQWLVMAEPAVFDELADKGYLFDSVTDLPAMGLQLAEVSAPTSFDISEVRQGVIDIVGSDRAEVDLNHFYTAGSPISSGDTEGIGPREAVPFPADMDGLDLRIGMIDSQVDRSHPALSRARIQSRAFVPQDAELPAFHGTAIASILAADDEGYRGLAPRAEVFAAAVFQRDDERGEIASTVSLVRALDWLISSGVDVVNLSLAGPPNRLLESALKRAAERDVMVLAAAGNGGPVAGPMYPAAYGTVVAVTAVDSQRRVYRLANRGSYLDLAAPGVGLLHARAGGGYAASSGTSFAVPFAVAAVARLRALNPGGDVLATLLSTAEDLGPPGRDDIYGYGLLRPGA